MAPTISPVAAGAVRAAVAAAAGLGVACAEPVVLADGANVIIHLRPSPVVAKVAATTTTVRADPAAWLQRELDLALFLTEADATSGRSWAGRKPGSARPTRRRSVRRSAR